MWGWSAAGDLFNRVTWRRHSECSEAPGGNKLKAVKSCSKMQNNVNSWTHSCKVFSSSASLQPATLDRVILAIMTPCKYFWTAGSNSRPKGFYNVSCSGGTAPLRTAYYPW